MYKIQVRRNVEGTIDYFLKDAELSAEERSGVWVGRGATMLGLTKATAEERMHVLDVRKPAATQGIAVTEDDLRFALHGYAPPSSEHGGKPLNGRYAQQGVRKCAWEIVLAPHKSVSVAALCLRGEHATQASLVKSAYQDATLETFQAMECLARRSNGSRPNIETFSLLAAQFTHEISRRNDPQMHTHYLVMNATHDPHDYARREWYALQSLQYYQQAREIDMVFQRALAQHLSTRGVDARMLTIDDLPATVLPSVDPAICHRLSRAHQAIQRQVAGRWQREERGIKEKRAENRFNDRLRPSKVGTLAARPAMYDRALSSAEAAQIVSTLYLKSPDTQREQPSILVPSLLPNPAVLHLIRRTGLKLNTASPTPAQITRAAIIASAESPEAPFIQFWVAARWHLPKMFNAPWDELSVGQQIETMLRSWRLSEEDRLLAVRTQNPPSHLPNVDTPAPAPGHQADEISVAVSSVETRPGSSPDYVPVRCQDQVELRL